MSSSFVNNYSAVWLSIELIHVHLFTFIDTSGKTRTMGGFSKVGCSHKVGGISCGPLKQN